MKAHPLILVVDDEKPNLKAIERLFFESDYQLLFAQNGEEALKIVKETRLSLVILDIMMPGISGLEVCSRIKEMDPNIMVLMLSARARLDDRLKGYGANADDYLVKPYNPDELTAKVSILIRLYNAQKALQEMNQTLENKVQKRTEALIAQDDRQLWHG